MKSRELRQRLGELTQQMRAILDGAEKAGRQELNADERQSYDKIENDITALEADIRRVDKLEERERQNAESLAARADNAGPGQNGPSVAEPQSVNQRASAVPEALARRIAHLSPTERADIQRRSTPEYASEFRSYLLNGRSALSEARAMQADSDIIGGSLVPPVEFVAELIKFLDDEVFIRQAATVRTVTASQSLGVPTWDADPDDSDWTAELQTGNEDSAARTGMREFKPTPLAKRMKVSRKLLRLAFTNAEQLIRERLGYKFAISQEKAFLTGTGANQPLGLFTASSSGISTSRDSLTGSATDITADGLIDAFYTLKAAYQRTASWLFHRDAIRRIRKLKDIANGNYLWQPGLAGGEPGTILDRPFLMSEYVPNTFTTGLYVGLVGDLRFYWIADALDMQVQRLEELYAETNQVGFIGRLETDAMPVLEEAFVRLKTN